MLNISVEVISSVEAVCETRMCITILIALSLLSSWNNRWNRTPRWIFTIIFYVVKQSLFDWQVGADGENHIRVGKLNLVDLAGSERQNKTQAEVTIIYNIYAAVWLDTMQLQLITLCAFVFVKVIMFWSFCEINNVTNEKEICL